jgi:hypothetical protein
MARDYPVSERVPIAEFGAGFGREQAKESRPGIKSGNELRRGARIRLTPALLRF